MPVRVGLVYREERAREDTGCMNSKVSQLGKPLTRPACPSDPQLILLERN